MKTIIIDGIKYKLVQLPSPSTKDDNTFQVDNGNSKTNMPKEESKTEKPETGFLEKVAKAVNEYQEAWWRIYQLLGFQPKDIPLPSEIWKAARETVDGFAWDQFRPLKYQSLEEFLNDKK